MHLRGHCFSAGAHNLNPLFWDEFLLSSRSELLPKLFLNSAPPLHHPCCRHSLPSITEGVNLALNLRTSHYTKLQLTFFLLFSFYLAQKGTVLDHLNEGKVLVGDGGMRFCLEKRGYVRAGPWTPECTVESPEAG